MAESRRGTAGSLASPSERIPAGSLASPSERAPYYAARSLKRVKVSVLILLAVAIAVAQQLGVFHVFAEPLRVKQALLELGLWGYVVFIAAYAVFQPFGVPGTGFILAAALIWPWPIAFGVSMAGTMAASVVGFSFARFIARDWVEQRVPARFRAYDEPLARRGFATVAALRFIFWMPPMLHAFFGISRVRFATHFWGSAVGYFLPLLLTAYFGDKLFDFMRGVPLDVWITWGVAAAAIVATLWFVRRRA